MALTIAVIDSTIFGNKRVVTADITFDVDYVTGGFTIDPARLGLSSIMHAAGGNQVDNSIQYINATRKLIVYVGSTGAQVAADVDLSAVKIRMMFYGQ